MEHTFEELVKIYDESKDEARNKLPLCSETEHLRYRVPIAVWQHDLSPNAFEVIGDVCPKINGGIIIFQFRKIFIRGIAVGWEPDV